MKVFAGTAALAIMGFVSIASADQIRAADQVCFPGPTTYKLAICSSSCNSVYCGANLPLLGRKTDASGVFITYYGTSDEDGIGTITVPNGLPDGRAPMRFMADEHTSLRVHVDEIPDFSIHVEVKREGGPVLFDSIDNANEDFVFDIPTSGVYQMHVVHRPNFPGGLSARYIPTVSLLPTIKPDTAGDNKEGARDLGPLTKDRPLQGEDFLQRVFARSEDGSLKNEELANDTADWFKFTTATAGRIKSTFKYTAILQSSDIPIMFGIADAGGPSPIPEGGVEISTGTHYLAAKAIETIVRKEFGHRYTFNITFEPK